MAISELLELQRIRLDEDLTYRELGDLVGVNRMTLYQLLNDPDTQPYDRTLHKIRRFLDSRREKPAPRRRRPTEGQVSA
jgi:transcriptional regulator with XRE-family HTH domain